MSLKDLDLLSVINTWTLNIPKLILHVKGNYMSFQNLSQQHQNGIWINAFCVTNDWITIDCHVLT